LNAPQYVRPESKAIASAAGARKAGLADPKKAERSTGYVVGPFGQRKHLRTRAKLPDKSIAIAIGRPE
jgi:prolyl-tRNA editing enzyme YbaK/EbsC (Cys-tRNA(Pro) deacylase)